MAINVGDIVRITLPTGGVLENYEVAAVPGKREIYWELFPVNDPTATTIVGPSFHTMVKLE